MTTHTGMHLAFDLINDLVDRRLSAREARDAERHLEVCVECRALHDRLQDVLSAAAVAPGTMEPAGDLWPSIRKEIDRRKEVPLPFVARMAPWARDSRSLARVRLAAGAVLLVAVSVAGTALVMRSGGGAAGPATVASGAPGAPAAAGDAARALPAAMVRAEAGYLRTAETLSAALEASRDSLSPATIATVEHSLRVIDDAIAEARAALLADPGSRPLAELLSAHYERKLDLLRRASELAPRT